MGKGLGNVSPATTGPLAHPILIGAEIYRSSTYGPRHPLRIPRVSTVMDLTRAMGWLPAGQYASSPRAKPKALHLWHQPEYVAALQRAEAQAQVSDATRERFGLGTTANPVFPEMYRRPATAAGGALLAAELLAHGGIVHHPAGGTHHGMPDRANGFCYVNDVALAFCAFRRLGVRRIAYVDIDAHHPDGVEAGFAHDPDVLMVSVHEERRWPFTGALSDVGAGQVFNLPVPRGLNDTEAAVIRDRLILPAVQRFAPEVIVLQCGADAVEEDPLARLSLSNNAHFAIVEALRGMAPRYLVTGGGGYNPWSVGRLWTGVWAVLNGLSVPVQIPPQAQAVLRGLRWTGHSQGRNPPAAWFTTLRDPPRTGAVRPEVVARLDQLTARLAAWV